MVDNYIATLNPEKNGLSQVLKDLTSPTLTVKINGVNKINRFIERCSDFCFHPISDASSSSSNSNQTPSPNPMARCQQAVQALRNWILDQNIIDNIFGPNCHVEIIKQSHTILNFVASSLTSEHVDIIWSASLMKHCGKQVLELLTSLVRFMRAGPVLHLYTLIKSLNAQDHSEYTLFLTSHVIKYIWCHSPSLNQNYYHYNRHLYQNQENFSGNQRQTNQQKIPSQKSSNKSEERPNKIDVQSISCLNKIVARRNRRKQIPNQLNKSSEILESYAQFQADDQEAKKQTSDVKEESEDDDIIEAIVEANSNSTQSSSQEQQESAAIKSSDRVAADTIDNNNIMTNVKFAKSLCQNLYNTDANEPDRKRSLLNLKSVEKLKEWLSSESQENFLDNTSEASACCSEEKNMADFDDTYADGDENYAEDDEVGQGYLQETYFTDDNSVSSTSSDTFNASNVSVHYSPEYKNDKAVASKSKVDQKQNRADSNIENAPTASAVSNLKDESNLSHPSEASKRSEGAVAIEEESNVQSEIEVERKLSSCSENNPSLAMAMDDDDLKGLAEYTISNLSDPGKTLLWDLLQDEHIRYLALNLHPEIENVFVGLIMSFGDRFIRLKFIEACLENLSTGASVIISLRLLPRLMSFNAPSRNLPLSTMTETHMIVLWAEKDFHMSHHFFKNFVQYSMAHQQQCNDSSRDVANTNSRNPSQQATSAINRPITFEFNHMDNIITRLSFLTFIYSKSFSPPSMKLSVEQMDHLWNCLAHDKQCADVLFQWLINQAVTDDLHAVDSDLLTYILKEKLPSLEPEKFTMRGLKLLEQLLWTKQEDGCCHSLKHPGNQSLWNIGLRASAPEVSMAAIRILNHFYIYSGHLKITRCDKGTNFIDQCMQQMNDTFKNFSECDDAYNEERLVTVIQRALVLLRTHLEVFRSRWSFYLRVLQLNEQANLVSHRSNTYELKSIMSIRVIVQAASRMEKTSIEIQTNDYVGELRAMILRWWFTVVENYQHLSPRNSSDSSITSSAAINMNDKSESSAASLDFCDFLLDHYQSLRLVCQNQDIPIDMDDRQVNELDLKDMQIIYVLSSAVRQNIDSEAFEVSITYPPKQEIPSSLLLQPKYFDQLLDAGEFLGSFQGKSTIINSRAQLLSRRVWEIIQVLPTSPSQLSACEKFGSPHTGLGHDTNDKIITLPDTKCPQRLLYSLQIVDILRSSPHIPIWTSMFIHNGGLGYLFEMFLSQDLLPIDDGNEVWNEWQQECLAYLLKLIYQFGTRAISPHSTGHHVEIISSSNSPASIKSQMSASSSKMIGQKYITSGTSKRLKKLKDNKNHQTVTIDLDERLPIRQLTPDLLKLIHPSDLIFSRLISIMKYCAYSSSQTDYCYVAISSRAMIIHHVMNFMASWCLSDTSFPQFMVSHYKSLIKTLILNDTDLSIRRESCNGLYKLHMSATFAVNKSHDETASVNSSRSSTSSIMSNATSCQQSIVKESGNISVREPDFAFTLDLLQCLIEFLPIAQAMKPPKPIRNYFESENEILKELLSPGCKDYFWLTCRMIDAASIEGIEDQGDSKDSHDSQQHTVDLNSICGYLASAIVERHTYETRDFSVEDDGLRGLLSVMVLALKKNPSFKRTSTAYNFIKELFSCLFATPNQHERYHPKCKSPGTRSTAFELMVELVDKNRKNYLLLVQLLIEQHDLIVRNTYPVDYWPHDDSRSEVGFVGLINLGATCYLATCIQHLFMIPHLRYAVLSLVDVSNIRHGETIKELQRMFAFMLESERKAYNPKDFCKHYIMDHQPLNIAEQKDMTEFLTDLIAKLEESSSELRYVIKSLFSGSLSNNVVSLDCPHISRTTEEFYTLRCQVADMRNLNDSLDELTVKDTLEGDNMYTCSTCGNKVRAEKRACIVKLPRILCFNTMRYTFNMATMTKEKVNTHFSFPLRLDMSNYLEKNLIRKPDGSPNQADKGDEDWDKNAPSSVGNESTSSDSAENPDENDRDSTLYDLIGVTVHTGTADGGHYYCFIRDCEDNSTNKERWYLFNDAEVKPFDSSHIGSECYGGEMTTKSYDAINDRFMDFSFEKTNSAYMLFYKRVDYQYSSQSVALRYQEADTQRNLIAEDLQSLKSYKVDEHDESAQDKETQNDTTDIGDSALKLIKMVDAAEKCRKKIKFDVDQTQSEINDDEEETSTSTDLNRVKLKLNFAELVNETYRDFELPAHLSEWIWADNTKFCRDKNVFEHNYYNFMWQTCANIPRNLMPATKFNRRDINNDSSTSLSSQEASEDQISQDLLTLKTIHLAISFVLGTLMHSREKPTISSWTEFLRKQFSTSQVACDWLMNLIDDEDTWLKQMLLKCPIEMVRQLFQRLCNDLTNSSQHKKLKLSR